MVRLLLLDWVGISFISVNGAKTQNPDQACAVLQQQQSFMISSSPGQKKTAPRFIESRGAALHPRWDGQQKTPAISRGVCQRVLIVNASASWQRKTPAVVSHTHTTGVQVRKAIHAVCLTRFFDDVHERKIKLDICQAIRLN